MAFTATDLTNVEAAITALATGSRVVECEIDGDLVQYHRTDIKSLLSLRDTIRAEIASASSTYNTRGNARIAVTTKGY
jgi:hypothetical protein